MDQHAIWSITPPILALVLAIATRNVLVSLGVGVTLGLIIVNGFHSWLGLLDVFERVIIAQLTEAANAEMVLIILVIGGFVHLMDRSGGMAAFAGRMTRVADSPRKAQLSAWVTGMAIFFTDSGNSLILGPMFRPIFARVRVCREKLAFIIDSTSSPVCVLVPIISWGVYIMSLLELLGRKALNQVATIVTPDLEVHPERRRSIFRRDTQRYLSLLPLDTTSRPRGHRRRLVKNSDSNPSRKP